MVSIIAPVYNTEKFISKCIHQILQQTYTDWELIVVDDCGTDHAIAIVEKMQQKDDRIKIVHHKANKGVDQARFTGLEHAVGKYVMFIDSDDWIATTALELLVSKIEFEKADLVYGSMVRVMDSLGFLKSKPKNNYSQELYSKSISNPVLFEEYFFSYFGVNKLIVSMWGKLYKREVLLKAALKPSFMKMGEDLIFNMQLHPYLDKIAFVPEVVYFYRYGGMTNSSNPQFLSNIKTQFRLKNEMIETYHYTKAYPYIVVELVNCFYSHFKNLLVLDKKDFKEVEQLLQLELNDPLYDVISDEIIKKNHKAAFIKNKNTDSILQLLLNEIKAQKTSNAVKRILSKILKNV